MAEIYKCGVDDCKYNRERECKANEVEINDVLTTSGFHPICGFVK